jgi:pyridoxine 5-phosphate synthase
MIRLSVRLDSVAALRRGAESRTPDLHAAAHAALLGGADAVRLRFTNERDVKALRQNLDGALHLDISSAPQEVEVAVHAKPERACLVPPRPPSPGATSLGLEPSHDREAWRAAIEVLRGKGVPVGIRLLPTEEALLAASEVGAEWVDLDTSAFAEAPNDALRLREFLALRKAAGTARQLGLRVTVGGNLRPPGLARLALLPEVEEVHLGFAVLARALFTGLTTAVRELKHDMWQARAARQAENQD